MSLPMPATPAEFWVMGGLWWARICYLLTHRMCGGDAGWCNFCNPQYFGNWLEFIVFRITRWNNLF